jgi:hypothetical protein
MLFLTMISLACKNTKTSPQIRQCVLRRFRSHSTTHGSARKVDDDQHTDVDKTQCAESPSVSVKSAIGVVDWRGCRATFCTCTPKELIGARNMDRYARADDITP